MANDKERTIFEKGNIHGDSIYGKMDECIYSLVDVEGNQYKHMPKSESKLRRVRAMVMNIGCALENPNRNIKDEAGRGI